MGQLISKTIKQTPLCKLHSHYHQRRLLSIRSISGSSLSAANDSGINIETNNGRLLVTLLDYIERIDLDRPDYVIAMADEVPYSVGKKRLAKAVRRTQQWFTELQKSPTLDWNKSSLIGVVVGSRSNFQESIINQTEFLLSHGARGILLGGVGQGETLEERSEVISLVRTACRDSSCPIFIQGIHTLEEILHAISCGIHYISTDYPAILTNSGLVLTVYLASSCKYGPTSFDESTRMIQRIPRSAIDVLNIWDPIYSRDMSPLGIDCRCHACRNYTRAYLHHLSVCHELLAEIMIYTHNFHTLLLLLENFSVLSS